MGPTASTVYPAQMARQELYEAIRADSTFEEKAEQALEIGRRYLGVENGHLTRIDVDTDHWGAMISTDAPGGQFPPGLELDLGTTYCRRTIVEPTPIALHDAPNQGWEDDPAFETHGIHCYHGTTLVVDGEPYGTVCFVAESRRKTAFSASETMFVELMTRLLERELERAHHEAQLTRQSNLATVLNRILRHNLRNDMSVIRGYTQMMKDDYDDATNADRALQEIDELLTLSEKARELERVVGNTFEQEHTDLGQLVERVAERVGRDYPAASFTLEIGDDVDIPVFPTFERAIEELVENAAKHGVSSPQVTISVDRVPNAIEIQIADDGPGLDQQECDVLSTGVETPLIHGSGLGLWIVHWIITTHGGGVQARVTDEGTEMELHIPAGPEIRFDEHVAELNQAMGLYEAAFSEAIEAMLIFDDDARIVDANRAAESIYGIEPRALLGRSITEFLSADFGFEAKWNEFQEEGVHRGVVTIHGVDGVERRVEYAARLDVVPGQHFMTVRPIDESDD